MKNLNRYACISTIYGCENYKATQINIFILQLQYIWPRIASIFLIIKLLSKILHEYYMTFVFLEF